MFIFKSCQRLQSLVFLLRLFVFLLIGTEVVLYLIYFDNKRADCEKRCRVNTAEENDNTIRDKSEMTER